MKKYLLSILSFVFYFNSNAQTADFIIRHGKVMDGMGNQWQYKDVAITQDKIVAVGSEQKGIKKALFFWALDLGLKYEYDGANGWWYEFQLAIANKIIFNKWRAALVVKY